MEKNKNLNVTHPLKEKILNYLFAVLEKCKEKQNHSGAYFFHINAVIRKISIQLSDCSLNIKQPD